MLRVSPPTGTPHAKLWIYDKSTALDGGAATITSHDVARTDVFSFAPSQTYAFDEDVQYMATVFSAGIFGLAYLELFAITGTAANPQFIQTNLLPTGPAWWNGLSGGNVTAPQKDSAVNIATNDVRILNSVIRDGDIWITNTVSTPATNPTHTAANFWQIDSESGTTTQTGLIEAPPLFLYYPSIAVNANHDILIGCSGSSYDSYASAYYCFIDGDTAVQTALTNFKSGSASYVRLDSAGRNRWGDYSISLVDPDNDLVMWTQQEFVATANNTWGTWWGMIETTHHSADTSRNWYIELAELLRVTQFYNTPAGFHCDSSTEDGYSPGTGSYICDYHDSDYNVLPNWHINLTELTRIIQFYNSGGYHLEEGTEDGFAPGQGGHLLLALQDASLTLFADAPPELTSPSTAILDIGLAEEMAGVLTSVALRVLLPRGYCFGSAECNDFPAITPKIGDTGTLDFAWIDTPQLPLKMRILIEKIARSNGTRPNAEVSLLLRGTGDQKKASITVPIPCKSGQEGG